MSEEGRRIIKLLQRLYAAIKSTNKNVSSMKEDNMVLLWENSSPGSAFATQTIALDLSDYKWVKIESLPTVSTNGKNVTTNEFKCPGAGNTFAPTTRTDMGSNGWWHGGRTVEITTTGITFGQGGFRYSNTTTQTANDSYGIPLRIWGLKKSYSVSLVKDVLPAENGGTGVTSLEELKSKLGVISGGGGSGGGGGPLTLSDSRLLQTYLSLKNVELYSSEDLWNSGSKTIPGISNYNTLLCKIDLGNSSCVLNRRTATTFQGSCNIPYDNWVATAAIELTISGDSATISQWEWLANTASSNHGVINKTYGVKEIVGVEPTEAYVKNQLELNDTAIENGTVKFKPVDVENRTLLWTNPDFGAATFAKQTIDVPWQDYDTICVEYAYNPGGSKPYKDSCTVSCPTLGGSSVGHLEFLWLTTAGASNGAERYFTIKDGGIEFDIGWYGANNAAASIHNEFCVPLYIYGIKNKVTVDIPGVELSNFGGATVIKKVWENASPTSSFAAQKIDIDTSDADFVVIVERYSTTSGSSEVFTIIPSMGGYLRTFAGAGYSTTGYCSRYVEFTSSQIKFGDNYLKSINTTTGGTVNNTYQIPTEIYTLKGVL